MITSSASSRISLADYPVGLGQGKIEAAQVGAAVRAHPDREVKAIGARLVDDGGGLSPAESFLDAPAHLLGGEIRVIGRDGDLDGDAREVLNGFPALRRRSRREKAP